MSEDALAELMVVIRRHRQHLGAWPNMHDEDAGMVERSPVYDPWRRARAAVDRAIAGLVAQELEQMGRPEYYIERLAYWREKASERDA